MELGLGVISIAWHKDWEQGKHLADLHLTVPLELTNSLSFHRKL